MRPSEKAWIALGFGVVLYEALAKEDEMLSHAVDRWLVSHKAITWGIVGATALHLLNCIPAAIDPWVLAFRFRRAVSG